MKHKIYLIAAADLKNGIGIKGKLPWDLKEDMAFFKKITTKSDDTNRRNMVIMGRSTWESIPKEHRPLMGRKNVVLTRNKKYEAPGAEIAHSIDAAINKATDRIEAIYIIGGAKVYHQSISRRDLSGIYLTRIKKEFKCDAFFPKIPPKFKQEKISTGEENGIKYDLLLYKK